MKLQLLKDDGASEQVLADARRHLQPAGEVWCIDLASRQVDWKFSATDAILGAIACGEDTLHFGARDGHLYRVSRDGRLLNKLNLHEPLVCSPALGRKHIYCTTTSGRLVCLEAAALKPVWESSLGAGEPFTSSPAIAHGHVYVGTAQQGLRCLGRPGYAEPPMWTHGDGGGRADDVRVPDELILEWQFPSEGSTPFHVTAPLLPLAGAIYVAGSRGGASEFVKLDVNLATADSERQVWARRFDRPLVVPPVGCGERLCVIESDASQPGVLHCLSASDGHTLWSHRLRDSPIGLTLDSHNVFAWTSATTLGCWDLVSGLVRWEEPTESRRGLGSPTVRNQIIFAATESSLSARDALTGGLLWRASLDEQPRGGPFLDGLQVLLPYDGKLSVHNVIDGQFIGWQTATDETEPWTIPDAVGMPITPPVALQGRVYFATKSGAVVCLGADAP
jgi:outer membrane protein assembly factor BamB